MTPTPRQGLFDLILPYWATYAYIAKTWVSATETRTGGELIVYLLGSFCLGFVVFVLDLYAVGDRIKHQAALDACCDSNCARREKREIWNTYFEQFLVGGVGCLLNGLLLWAVTK
jgi:hypothetical protein